MEKFIIHSVNNFSNDISSGTNLIMQIMRAYFLGLAGKKCVWLKAVGPVCEGCRPEGLISRGLENSQDTFDLAISMHLTAASWFVPLEFFATTYYMYYTCL